MKLIATHTLYQDTEFKALSDVIALSDTPDSSKKGVITANVNDLTLITVDLCLSWVVGGGEVLDLPLFIKIDDENDNVPTGLTGDTYIDEDDNEQNNTWLTWLRPNNHVFDREGQKYVSTKGHTGSPLPVSELTVVGADLVLTIPDAPGGE